MIKITWPAYVNTRMSQGLSKIFIDVCYADYVLGSTHVVEQLSFSLFLSILKFTFDLIFGSFFTFWGPNGQFLGLGKGSYTVLGLLM